MYCKLKNPMSIVYRFNTGEVLLSVLGGDGHWFGISICNCYVWANRLSSDVGLGMGHGTPIKSATITQTLGCGIYGIDMVCFDGLTRTVGWWSGGKYDANRDIMCDVFMHSDSVTIVSIPHSLPDFFLIGPVGEFISVVRGSMLMRGNGYERIIQFKCKMLLVIIALSQLVPQELVAYMVIDACYAYKNHDYVEYLQLR